MAHSPSHFMDSYSGDPHFPSIGSDRSPHLLLRAVFLEVPWFAPMRMPTSFALWTTAPPSSRRWKTSGSGWAKSHRPIRTPILHTHTQPQRKRTRECSMLLSPRGGGRRNSPSVNPRIAPLTAEPVHVCHIPRLFLFCAHRDPIASPQHNILNPKAVGRRSERNMHETWRRDLHGTNCGKMPANQSRIM